VYSARYLLGCDGPASFVGIKLDTRFDGFTQLHSSRSLFLRAPTLLQALEGRLKEVLSLSLLKEVLSLSLSLSLSPSMYDM
jgi:hypothetical protein